MAKKVWLDAGHGGWDPGACANGLRESDITLTMAFETKRVLEAYGIIVGMTRTTDVYVDLNERCRLANEWGADYFISEHVNAGGGDGAEAIHSIFYGAGTELAKTVVSTIDELTPQNLRPHPTYSKVNSAGNADYFCVIRDTNMSSIIVECAFIDSADVQVIDTIEEQKLMGRVIAYGILRHLGIPHDETKDAGVTPAPTPVPAPSQPAPVQTGYKANAVALVALDPRNVPSTQYTDMGEIYRNEQFQVLPEVCDNGNYLPIKYWKDSLGIPSVKVWINANKKYIKVLDNAKVVNVISELDARYNPSPTSGRMGFVKNGETLYCHKVEGNYALCTYHAGTGFKTAWFTKTYVQLV